MMKEFTEVRGDIKEMRDSVVTDSHLLHHCQTSLTEDVLVVRDSQTMVRDAMDRLSKVEASFNMRPTKIEASTDKRLTDLEVGVSAIFSMQKEQGNLLQQIL